MGVSPPEPTVVELKEAATFVERLEHMIEERHQEVARSKNPFTSLYLRSISAIAAFQAGAQQGEPAYRLHQFVRAVEAFMPASVRGAADFVKRGSALLRQDSGDADVLKQMYDLRSATEHHRPFDQRALSGVSNPNDIAMQRGRQGEALAREVLRRFIAGPRDFLPHLRDETSLQNLWVNPPRVSQAWGTSFDINTIA